ncbi:DUF397 domain-containing protein [Streptomyces sp. NPDC046876]|uniref:DUF397 domain-containing protein n=1 Tax=Streptomyces sp. NPDC046876 TaxID=3155616 RepID=UPI0033F36735
MTHNSELAWFKSSYSDGSEGDSCVEVAWRKSSYSDSGDINDCIEVAWKKSSHSSSSNIEDCVEVAAAPTAIHVRDSKDITRPHLTFGRTAWTEFIALARP